MKEGTVAYLAALVHPSDREFHKFMLALNAGEIDSFDLSAPPAAQGAAAQMKGLESTEILEGLIGGSPPLPLKPLRTVSVTYELVASGSYSERRVALLTKAVLDLRAILRGVYDGGLRIEAPELDQPRRFLPHSGAVKHLNGEVESFIEANSDTIWIAIFALGFLGSALSGVLAVVRSRRRHRV